MQTSWLLFDPSLAYFVSLDAGVHSTFDSAALRVPLYTFRILSCQWWKENQTFCHVNLTESLIGLLAIQDVALRYLERSTVSLRILCGSWTNQRMPHVMIQHRHSRQAYPIKVNHALACLQLSGRSESAKHLSFAPIAMFDLPSSALHISVSNDVYVTILVA